MLHAMYTYLFVSTVEWGRGIRYGRKPGGDAETPDKPVNSSTVKAERILID